MDYQILNNEFKLNLNKNIGKVLYIVEGERREINLLGTVFKKVLKYEEVISIARNGKEQFTYTNIKNENSKIVIINSETSNVASIENTGFIDKQIENIKMYDLDFNYEDAAIFYIFDCDRDKDEMVIEDKIKKFTNSREPSKENEFDSIGGMLLLSYPAIETFIISNFEKDMYKFNKRFDFETQKLKKYINDKKYDNSKLSVETLKNSYIEMINSLNNIGINRIDLDNVLDFNNDIFQYEKLNNKKYMLSLLLISFVDLGIIEIL